MVDQAEIYEIEPIPVEDSVSRGCEFPFSLPSGVDIESFFLFPSDKITGKREESVYWRKYADTIDSVHERECLRVSIANGRRALKEQAPHEYIGARTASVWAILDIKSQRGFGFAVNHLPVDGTRAHTHICILEPAGANKTKPADRMELIHMLCAVFGGIEKHSCPPSQE